MSLKRDLEAGSFGFGCVAGTPDSSVSERGPGMDLWDFAEAAAAGEGRGARD